MQNLPEIVTTTQIQRNPSLLSDLVGDQYRIVVKGGKKVAAIISVEMIEKMLDRTIKAKNIKPKPYKIPKSLLKALQKIDPIKFQEEIRA